MSRFQPSPDPSRLAVLALTFLALATVAPPLAAQPNPAELSPAGKAAFDKWQQGDVDGAIEALAAQLAAGGATLVDRALLGTLYVETDRPALGFEVLKPVADTDTADPAVLYNAGRAALRIGDVESAERYLVRSVARMPISPAARELGILYGAQRRFPEAYRLLRAWALQNPDDREASVAAVAAALQLGRAAEVGPLVDGLPAGEPQYDLLRAQHRLQTGDSRAAIDLLEGLLKAAPAAEMAPDVARLLATAYLDVGRTQDAADVLAERVGDDPRRALLLAEARGRQGDAAAAVAVLEPFAAAALGKEAPGPLAVQLFLDHGRHLLAAGRAADALPYFERATAVDPSQQLGWKSLGEALNALGRRDEAETALARFRELAESEAARRQQGTAGGDDPVNKSVAEAQQAILAGELPRALAIVRQEMALSPRDPRPRLLEVAVLLRLSRPQDALSAAETTVQLFPQNPDTLYQRGVVQMVLNAPAAAEQDFRRALELAPNHVAALSDLAVVLMARGERDSARALLQRVLELRPGDPHATRTLRELDGGG